VETAIIGLLAETSLHPGTEGSTGAIDLPVAREAATRYPVIVGSSLKGALRDLARQVWTGNDLNDVFGKQENAGAFAVTDARLLLLPVRSLTGHYRWVTCPYVLQRYRRDRLLANLESALAPSDPGRGRLLSRGAGKLFLEELSFECVTTDLSDIIREIAPLVSHQSVSERLADQTVIVSDDEFTYFATNSLPVNARNVLDEETKTSENLWYEETLPPDTLFYACLLTRPGRASALARLREMFATRPYLQVGGNETIGQGWCCVTWLPGGGVSAD